MKLELGRLVFKLDKENYSGGHIAKSYLRTALRDSKLSFKRLEDYPSYIPVNNFDGLLFGVNDKWRGVLNFIPKEPVKEDNLFKYEVNVFIKSFNIYKIEEKDIEFIKELIKKGIEKLKKDNTIEDSSS